MGPIFVMKCNQTSKCSLRAKKLKLKKKIGFQIILSNFSNYVPITNSRILSEIWHNRPKFLISLEKLVGSTFAEFCKKIRDLRFSFGRVLPRSAAFIFVCLFVDVLLNYQKVHLVLRERKKIEI